MMACDGARPPTDAEIDQVAQDVLALLRSKYHVYQEPLEQFRARLACMGFTPALIDEQSQLIQQQRQQADEAIKCGIYEVLWQDRCESF